MRFDITRRLRLFSILAVSFVILSTLGALGYITNEAISSMATSANEMDDARARSAASGALTSLKKQLGATIRDNAYWDDAFSSLEGDAAADWATENWGSTTTDYPLYDTAIVLRADGSPLIAYHKGAEIRDLDGVFLGSIKSVEAAARRAGFRADKLPVTFAKTRQGIALIGAAAVQPSVGDFEFNIEKANVLIYSKQLTSDVVDDIATSFGIQGLRLKEGVGVSNEHAAGIHDLSGREIAYLTWPPLHPGTASYLRIKPTIVGAGSVLLLLLGLVGGCGYLTFRGVREGERTANYKAKHDPLTGLWNRAGCLEMLEQSVESQHSDHISFYMLDLDGFKPVNDAWGHAVGDKLIRAVADRLTASLPSPAIVARLGGDEFAILTTQAFGSDTRPLADQVIRALATPFMIDGRTIEIGGSVGWITARPQELDCAEFLRRADLALYRAKDLGRGVAVPYDASLDEDAGRHSELEQELRRSLARKEINVAFQPLLGAQDGEIAGVEALARWTSPTLGTVSPDVFIDVAEKAGLIDQLGLQVLEAAIREGTHWPSIGVAVNISPLQLKNPYFVRQVKEVLVGSSFDPTRLTIEVTESVLISNPDQAKRAFRGLHEMGVKIALDDFGCGYASVGTLREFGFDSMKIDRSLIVAVIQEENGGAVLQATVALANALRLPVTAEGIETEEQAMAVRMSGCEKVQGYLFQQAGNRERNHG